MQYFFEQSNRVQPCLVLVAYQALFVSRADLTQSSVSSCQDATERHFLTDLLPNSGAQALARPGESFDSAFEASENRLLACQALGHAPWRFGHNIICVAAPACDYADLVRHVALPFYLDAVGASQPTEVLQTLLLQPIGHWRDMRADFVVAGFESGGTTSLVTMLRNGPDIFMMPTESADWAHDFDQPRSPLPSCEAILDGPSRYWPAFMSYAFWPHKDTVQRFNMLVARCASHKLVGVWDSRYAAHDLAIRKVKALVGSKRHGRVILSFRDPVSYVISTFNRLTPEAPCGGSLEAIVTGAGRCADPYALHLWKGNYSILAQKMLMSLSADKLLVLPFLSLLRQPVEIFGKVFAFLGSSSTSSAGVLAHANIGPKGSDMRVDPCSGMHRRVLQRLASIYAPEYRRMANLLETMGQDLMRIEPPRGPSWTC